MKFSLFVHMERISPQQSHRELYQEMVDLCEMADSGGFHAWYFAMHYPQRIEQLVVIGSFHLAGAVREMLLSRAKP